MAHNEANTKQTVWKTPTKTLQIQLHASESRNKSLGGTCDSYEPDLITPVTDDDDDDDDRHRVLPRALVSSIKTQQTYPYRMEIRH